MQELILIVPLIFCYFSERPHHHKHYVTIPIYQSFDLPPNSETITFVVPE